MFPPPPRAQQRLPWLLVAVPPALPGTRQEEETPLKTRQAPQSNRKPNRNRKTPATRIGIITAVYGNRCNVLVDGEPLTCFTRKDISRSGHSPPVVGDHVAVSQASDNVYVLEDILPRRTLLSRADPSSPHLEQSIAANADIGAIVIAITAPPIHPRVIDRCLIAVERGGLEPLICVNKVDLLAPDEVERKLGILRPYVDLGVRVVACSAKTGHGIDRLLELFTGKVAVLLGHSGVGKSSLITAMNPRLDLATNTVRRSDRKGRHTTTAAMLYQPVPGITIIDTPGFREFGIHGVSSDELKRYFPEFRSPAGACQFPDCSHTSEPDCGVKLAVRAGTISRERYESYLKLFCGPAGGAASEKHGTVPTESSRCEASFTCAHCGAMVIPEGAGTKHRNHCPRCLWSLHLDHRPGDRTSCCDGQMEPVAVWIRDGGEWAIIHRCRECGVLGSNRIAADDNELLLLSLAVKPLSMPPFPLSRIGKLVDQ